MTSEEAIEIFKEIREELIAKETELSKQVFENLGIKAIDLAIKALEQIELNPSYNGVKTELEPCGDCISRQAVIKHICESKECYKDECKGRLYKRCYDLQWIYALPSVTPQPKIGKWIDTGIGKEEFYGEMFVCSECNEVSYYENYCPNCGAKMEAENESNN